MNKDIREQPISVQVAVLWERVDNLADKVEGQTRALWAFAGSFLIAALTFAITWGTR